METIIFAILSVLLIWCYIHEDWFIRLEDKLLRLGVVIVSLVCKKILQMLSKYGKLKPTNNKEVRHARHIKRIQSI